MTTITNELDNEGYLINPEHWTKNISFVIADLDQLMLSNDHWFIINYLRQFYQEFPTIKIPAMRVLIKTMREQLGVEKGNSIYFHRLFPGGLVQACKIAGLPKSAKCSKNVF